MYYLSSSLGDGLRGPEPLRSRQRSHESLRCACFVYWRISTGAGPGDLPSSRCKNVTLSCGRALETSTSHLNGDASALPRGPRERLCVPGRLSPEGCPLPTWCPCCGLRRRPVGWPEQELLPRPSLPIGLDPEETRQRRRTGL